DVGDADYHDAHRKTRPAAVGRQKLAELDQLFHVGVLLGRHGQCAHAGLGFEIADPGLGDGGIGQVVLVQDLDAGFVAAHFLQLVIGAGGGQASVKDLDNHV